jgi:hypothetical protein
VRYYGARRLLELEKLFPPSGRRMGVPVLISEVDSTWLKAQRRNRPVVSVRHFPVHLGLHYTGRVRRYAARGSPSARLQNKALPASAVLLAQFGRRFQWEGPRRFHAPRHIILSDGNVKGGNGCARCFPQAMWLLDHWHIARAVRDSAANDQAEYQRLMVPVWQADSEAVLEALRTGRLRYQRPKAFHELFGYVLGNREGIDAWKSVPAALRRSTGRAAAVVKCGSGAVEKHRS